MRFLAVSVCLTQRLNEPSLAVRPHLCTIGYVYHTWCMSNWTCWMCVSLWWALPVTAATEEPHDFPGSLILPLCEQTPSVRHQREKMGQLLKWNTKTKQCILWSCLLCLMTIILTCCIATVPCIKYSPPLNCSTFCSVTNWIINWLKGLFTIWFAQCLEGEKHVLLWHKQ